MNIATFNSYMVDECKNYLYILFKHNYYTREIWFKYLDYFNVNSMNNLFPIILPMIIINFLIFYIFVLLIKKTINEYNKRAFYSKIF
jgi:hypothetical protein